MHLVSLTAKQRPLAITHTTLPLAGARVPLEPAAHALGVPHCKAKARGAPTRDCAEGAGEEVLTLSVRC